MTATAPRRKTRVRNSNSKLEKTLKEHGVDQAFRRMRETVERATAGGNTARLILAKWQQEVAKRGLDATCCANIIMGHSLSDEAGRMKCGMPKALKTLVDCLSAFAEVQG